MLSLSLATAVLCTMLMGALAALWGKIPWALSQRASNGELMGRRCQWVFSAILALVFPCLGHFHEEWGGKGPLFLGILGSTLGLALLGQHQSLRAGLLAALLVCLSIPLVTLPTLLMLPRALELSPVLALNAGFVVISLAGLLTPILLKQMWKRFSFRNGFLMLGLACLLPALLVSLTPDEIFFPPRPVPPAEPRQKGKEAGRREPAPAPVSPLPARDSHRWVLAALGFVMLPLVILSGICRRAFLAQREAVGRWTHPGYWLAYLAILIPVGWIVPDDYAAWSLLCLAAVQAVVLGNLASDYGQRGGNVGFWLAAASFAPLLPILLAIPFVFFSDAREAAVLGELCGSMCLSYFLLGGLIERWSSTWTAPAMIRLTLMFTLIFGALALALGLMHSELYGNPTRIRKNTKQRAAIVNENTFPISFTA